MRQKGSGNYQIVVVVASLLNVRGLALLPYININYFN